MSKIHKYDDEPPSGRFFIRQQFTIPPHIKHKVQDLAELWEVPMSRVIRILVRQEWDKHFEEEKD